MRSHAKDASAPSTHRENATFSLGVFAAMLVCAAAFLGIGASAAGAATVGESYGYTKDIGTPDGGSISGVFFNVVSVSNDGNVFIVRQGNPLESRDPAVDVVDPATGTSLSRPLVVPDPLAPNFFPAGVAASPDGSEIFVTDAETATRMRKLVRTDTAPLTYALDPSWDPGPLQGVAGIAVDPSTGDLIAAVGGRIFRFDSTSGAVLSSFDGSNTDAGSFLLPRTIAVAPNGDIYVADDPGRVEHFAADGSWKGTIPLPNSAVASGVAVNPQSSEVAVELPAGYGTTDPVIKFYSAANDLEDIIRVAPAQANDDFGQYHNRGLAFSPDGSELYVGLKNGSAHVYTRSTQPGVDAPVVSNITATGAHVSATVATGGESTLTRLEYCLASDPCAQNLTSEGESPWHPLAEESGSATTTIEGDVTGLIPNTRYLLRTFAENTTNHVENRSATTELTTAIPPPLVSTNPASDVTDTQAQLNGSVDNTFGDQTRFYFEYGPTTSYGSRMPTGAEGIAGNERTPRAFSRLVEGLQPGTTYHYRLVATNSGGATAGADRTFTTLAVVEVAPHRGYEQVTPADKDGLALMANWGFQASPDGSAFEFGATGPPSDASSAAAVSRYISRRGSGDWVGPQSLDPPFHPVRAVVNAVTIAVSDDFEHAVVVSQYALAPGATEGAANIYVKDLTADTYRLVGTSTENGAFVGMTGILQLNTFTAGAPDFSWLVLLSRYKLLPGAPQNAMYKWTSTGGLSLISLLPGDGTPTGNVQPQNSPRVTNRLVSDDGDTVVFSLEGGDDGVYRRSGGETEEVSLGQASGGPTGLQPGTVDGMSRDGRYVLFHSPSQLTDEDQDGGTSEYRYDASTEQQEYLGPQDGTSDGRLDTLGIAGDASTVYFNGNNELLAWREGQPKPEVLSPVAARGDSFGYASPSGRYFEFLDAQGAARLYDAVTGETDCISCTADGTAARGHLPVPDRSISNRIPQSVTDDGHAYFDTFAPLVSADRNGSSDVYEYFRGRLTLISPGDQDFDATLADISVDGSDVFFVTAQGLVSQDTDQTYDVYDARIGGGLPDQNPPPPVVPCAGDACQGAATPPPPALTPGSSGFKGNGHAGKRNCAKNKRKVTRNGKTRCVKKKPHRSKKRNAKHNRGTGR